MKRALQTNTAILLVVAAVIGAVWEFIPIADASQRLKQLPKEGYGFRTRELELTPNEAEHFHDVSTVKRLCSVNGQMFVMLVIDGSRNRHAVHDPLYCIRGDGWNINCAVQRPIERGWARYIRATRGDRETEALYWFSNGEIRHGSATQYFCQATLRRITLGRSSEEPVLVVLQPANEEIVDWDAALESVLLMEI